MNLKTIQKVKDMIDSLDLASYQLTLVFKDNTELHVVKPPDAPEETKIGFFRINYIFTCNFTYSIL